MGESSVRKELEAVGSMNVKIIVNIKNKKKFNKKFDSHIRAEV